jgi:hypothetical protein
LQHRKLSAQKEGDGPPQYPFLASPSPKEEESISYQTVPFGTVSLIVSSSRT